MIVREMRQDAMSCGRIRRYEDQCLSRRQALLHRFHYDIDVWPVAQDDSSSSYNITSPIDGASR
jgi:hypothetical protein